MTDDFDAPSRIGRIAGASATIVALRDEIAAGQQWPTGSSAGDGPEAEWAPPEVLAHAAEMLQYWLGEIERVLAGTPEPVAFGRVATDPLRTLTIERDRTLPPGELIDRIQSSVARYQARLPRLAPADWERRGLHPRLGEMTVAGMLDRFVVGHLEEHAIQLRESLAGSARAART